MAIKFSGSLNIIGATWLTTITPVFEDLFDGSGPLAGHVSNTGNVWAHSQYGTLIVNSGAIEVDPATNNVYADYDVPGKVLPSNMIIEAVVNFSPVQGVPVVNPESANTTLAFNIINGTQFSISYAPASLGSSVISAVQMDSILDSSSGSWVIPYDIQPNVDYTLRYEIQGLTEALYLDGTLIKTYEFPAQLGPYTLEVSVHDNIAFGQTPWYNPAQIKSIVITPRFGTEYPSPPVPTGGLTKETAIPLTSNVIQQQGPVGGDTIWYTFTTDGTSSIYLYTGRDNFAYDDTVMAVYAEDGTLVVWNDDKNFDGGIYSSEITAPSTGSPSVPSDVPMLAAGTYYVVVVYYQSDVAEPFGPDFAITIGSTPYRNFLWMDSTITFIKS